MVCTSSGHAEQTEIIFQGLVLVSEWHIIWNNEKIANCLSKLNFKREMQSLRFLLKKKGVRLLVVDVGSLKGNMVF